MRPSQIESWALEVVDRVQAGIPIEDFRLELKATWIAPEKAARRIAGHANAARGAPILWLIGIDEKYGVVGVDHDRFLSWHHQMTACFDGIAPSVIDMIIPVNGATIVALLFETDRAPFIVQNPVFGRQGGGPVQWEIPWREGTAIRSARRQDVMRLLMPLQRRPSFEILDGQIQADFNRPDADSLLWRMSLSLYNAAIGDDRIVIPFHKCQAAFKCGENGSWIGFDSILIRPPYRVGGFSSSLQAMLSLTIQGTPDEVFITGPGKLLLEAEVETPLLGDLRQAVVKTSISLLAIDADHPIHLAFDFEPAVPENGAAFNWSLM